jgi:hypothetical protein
VLINSISNPFVMPFSFKAILAVVALSSLRAEYAVAFSTPTTTCPAFVGRGNPLKALGEGLSSTTSGPTDRRAALAKVVGLWTLSAGVLGVGLPAQADVSDGNALPEGAAQFGRIIRAKADLIVSCSSQRFHSYWSLCTTF